MPGFKVRPTKSTVLCGAILLAAGWTWRSRRRVTTDEHLFEDPVSAKLRHDAANALMSLELAMSLDPSDVDRLRPRLLEQIALLRAYMHHHDLSGGLVDAPGSPTPPPRA